MFTLPEVDLDKLFLKLLNFFHQYLLLIPPVILSIYTLFTKKCSTGSIMFGLNEDTVIGTDNVVSSLSIISLLKNNQKHIANPVSLVRLITGPKVSFQR